MPSATVKGSQSGPQPKIHMVVVWPASPSVGVDKPEKEHYELDDLAMAEFAAEFSIMLGGKVIDFHQH